MSPLVTFLIVIGILIGDLKPKELVGWVRVIV